MTKIITVDNIKMSYRSTPILNGVSFGMEKGEAVSLIGSNGAGKSTLIRCVLGLENISNGTINLFGNEIQNVENRKLRLVRCRVGVVFQKHNLVPRLSVLSNVIHGALGQNTQSIGSFLSGIRL